MTETIRPSGGRYIAHKKGLTNGSDFTITATKLGGQDYYEATVYTVGASCDVKHVFDADGDFSSPTSEITLDSFHGNGISDGNATPIVHSRLALRITNTSGNSQDVVVIVDDPDLPRERD